MSRRLRLIVNPHAGGGRPLAALPDVEAALHAAGVEFSVQQTTGIEHAQALARGAVQAGDVAVSYGGDGLAGAVAHALRGTGGTLGLLPGGRGNDFARKLGIPADPVAACALLRNPEKSIDLAAVGDRTYLGILSAGLDSDANRLANENTLPLGTAVYAYAALRALAAWKTAHWTVTIDGETREFDGYSVAVSNSGVYGSGMFLVPDARMDDGMLDVVLAEALPKRRYLANVPKVFKGTHVDEPGLTFLSGRRVSFHADRPFTAYADGDPIADLPATIEVVPGTLRVLAP